MEKESIIKITLLSQTTFCFVTKHEYRGQVQCSCGSEGNGRTECYSEYPCIAVFVNYTVQSDNVSKIKTQKINSLFWNLSSEQVEYDLKERFLMT